MIDKIEFVGLRKFQLGLKEVQVGLPAELRLINLQAARLVASGAASRASSLGGVAAKAAESIKPVAQQTSAGVRIGGARYPFAPGAEFGSTKYRQFKPWKGNGADAGYWLFPTARAAIPTIRLYYQRAFMSLARKAFPD